jgi:hypothetical protein
VAHHEQHQQTILVGIHRKNHIVNSYFEVGKCPLV